MIFSLTLSLNRTKYYYPYNEELCESNGQRKQLVYFPPEEVSMEKLNAGLFDGPQIRELMKNAMFDEELSKAKLLAWQSLKSVVKNFQGNHWSAEYEKEIEELILKSFRQLKARMSVKLHFLQSYLDYFLKN